MLGWGAVFNLSSTGGRWQQSESTSHINVLELKAIWFGLKSFCDKLRDTHIRLRSDSSTAVAYINEMGSCKSPSCNAITCTIWNWTLCRNIWLSAEFLPGSQNVLADRESRLFHDTTEWMLDKKVFDVVSKHFSTPDIDLFASQKLFIVFCGIMVPDI